jgi:hypothetical protein
VPSSTSFRNFSATERSDVSGHGWNQSMTVELIVARKRWERMRKLSPFGEAVNTMCRFCFTLFINVAQQLSLVSTSPAALVSPRIAFINSSLSSAGNRSGISPDDSRSLTKTSIFSSTTCNSPRTVVAGIYLDNTTESWWLACWLISSIVCFTGSTDPNRFPGLSCCFDPLFASVSVN